MVRDVLCSAHFTLFGPGGNRRTAMIDPDRLGHVITRALELMKELPEVKTIFVASNRHELALTRTPPAPPSRHESEMDYRTPFAH
jgi:hypothetical protein